MESAPSPQTSLPPLFLLLLPLLLHVTLRSSLRQLLPAPALPAPLAPPPPTSTTTQLELYTLGSACHRQYLELLTPMPRPARSGCRAPSVLGALASGSRASWDAPFSLGTCALQWYTASEACALLSRLGTLAVIGDSLQRHLLQALFAVLRGDYELGASLAPRVPPGPCWAACACEGQYSDLSGADTACALDPPPLPQGGQRCLHGQRARPLPGCPGLPSLGPRPRELYLCCVCPL